MKIKFLILVIITITSGETKKSFQDNCGTKKPLQPIITGANSTVRGEHPWKAALINDEGKYFCGGSLISNKALVTSANCIKGKDEIHEVKPEDITVVLGADDLSKSFEKGRITVGVKTIHIHPDWNIYSDSYDGDIALLIFETEIQFSATIQPICLFTPQSPSAQVNEGIFIGFQKIKGINKAKKLTLSIKSYHSCVKQNDDLKSFLTSRTICAGSGDEEDVEAGSGSGLYVFYKNRFYLRGVASASSLHNKLNYVSTYGMFADTIDYCGWIQSGGLNKYAKCSEYDFATSTNLPTTTSRITTQPTTTFRKTTRSTTSLKTTTVKPIKNVLYAGECLNAKEYIESPNKCFKVYYQEDGNFVNYRASSMQHTWQSKTHGSCPKHACMQGDGNFVVYDCYGAATWHTKSHGNPGARIVIQDDGNLVLYTPNNVALWNSRTVTHC